MSRSAWRALAVVATVLLAIPSGCLIGRQGSVAPPSAAQPPSATPIWITVRAITNTPVALPATKTPTPMPPTRTATYPVPLDILTRTNTPNPSTLITPSPAVLPVTGADDGRGRTSPLLVGVGMILACIGLVIWRSRKLSW